MTAPRKPARARARNTNRKRADAAPPDLPAAAPDLPAATVSVADRAVLSDLALGELSLEVATDFVAEALARDDDHVSGDIYDALSANVWNLAISRTFGDQARPWFELYRYAIANLAERGRSELALKLEGAADIALQSVRYRPSEEPLAPRRAHEIQILTLLLSADELPRQQLMDITGLQQANLSRILANLTSEGLIRRRTEGRGVLVSITLDGREFVKRSGRRALLATYPAVNVGFGG